MAIKKDPRKADYEHRYRQNKLLCNAKKNTCKAYAMRGGTKCYNHGGASLGGLASPRFKSGRYSRFLPEHLKDRYEESLNDPNLIALNSEIALLDTRLFDVVQRVETSESGKLWEELNEQIGSIISSADEEGQVNVSHVQLLKAQAERGLGDYQTWKELGELIEQRRKLVDSERKYLATNDQFVTAGQVMLLMGAIAQIIRKYVQDTTLLQRISLELAELNSFDNAPVNTDTRLVNGANIGGNGTPAGVKYVPSRPR